VVFGLVLLISEDAPVSHVLFETASAFGTVGLSTGLTAELTVAGRLAVIVLMFLGRLGPLTILAAASGRRRRLDVEYPAGQVSIG
jgi:trk system potassium uptake protein TrkH